MPAHKVLPPINDLVRQVEAGKTHAQIAEWIFETTGQRVSRSTVSAALHRAGKTNRVRYDKHLPWQVRNEHANLYHAIMLRLVAREELGEQLSEMNAKRLANWKRSMTADNAVIHYDPDTHQGWFRLRRRDGVDLGWIREPPGRPNS